MVTIRFASIFFPKPGGQQVSGDASPLEADGSDTAARVVERRKRASVPLSRSSITTTG